MKKLKFENIIDQRKLSTHAYFLLFSMVIVGLTKAFNPDFKTRGDYFTLLCILFIQLEVFIFLGTKIFKGLSPVSGPKEVTRLLLSRFLVFYVGCFISAFIIMIGIVCIQSLITHMDISMVLGNFFQYEFWKWFKKTSGGLSVGAVIFIFVLWQDALKREQELREKNLVFQNETLKSQVNPHFLFNSLNTISSLVQTQPEAAGLFINNLSSVYRYILDNSQKDTVPLQAELDFIENYFDLHKVRDEEKILLGINAPGSEAYRILPVSLQILLENAIKHNIATRENQLRISVYIEDQFIVVKNNLQRKATQLPSTKTGLKNLAERVRLATSKELIIDETDDYFTVKLPLLQ